MWIITKDSGILNTDHFSWIKEDSYGMTLAYSLASDKKTIISIKPVLDKITEALINGATFVEVD